MKNLTWQNPEQLFVAQELINKVKSKCCGIKDTYYLRCKLFHGEVPDSTFKLKPTDEDWEIEELGKLLEIVVFELLEHNHIFR